METYNSIQIAAPFDALFQMASDVSRWPEILPHYRWVKVQEEGETRSVVEMAARHKGIPLRWKAIQILMPDQQRIHYSHIEGITRGMEVEWIFQEVSPEGACPLWHVRIDHVFNPSWGPASAWLSRNIVGRMFIQQVAGKTLACMKKHLESKT